LSKAHVFQIAFFIPEDTAHQSQTSFDQVSAARTEAFELSVEQVLGPSLQPGQMVVMDNLRIHKGEWARQAIEAHDCQVLFLPSSPDFSPIEEAFSKRKRLLTQSGSTHARGSARSPHTSSHQAVISLHS